MIRVFLLIVLFISVSLAQGNTKITSFSKAKKILLKDIYYDNKISFYCNNPYEIKKVKNRYKAMIIKDDKYYSPRKQFYKSGKPNIRAERIGSM